MTLPAALMILLLQAAQPKAGIAGAVFHAGSGEPLAKAHISVSRIAGPEGDPVPKSLSRPSVPPVTSDNQGRFLIQNLEPGSYIVNAERNGFARREYGVPLTLAAGQVFKDVVFRLAPGGAISGRVADAAGAPLAGITVHIRQSAYDSDGKKTFTSVAESRTNDRGEYRAYWLTPGRYHAIADPPILPQSESEASPMEALEPGYVATYYPGTTDRASAAVIDVEPGSDIRGIDFTLRQQPVFRIRGRLADEGMANLLASVLFLVPRSKNCVVCSSFNMSADGWSGPFEFKNVVPGSYWISANIEDRDFGPFAGKETVLAAVEVTNADVENVVITVDSPFPIRGRIQLEGASLSENDRERMWLELDSVEESPGGFPAARIQPDGAFTINNALPGNYLLRMFRPPPNTYIKAARLGATDVMNGLSINGPVTDSLDILLSTHAGQIEGTIVNKDRNPARGIEAVLIPEQQAERAPDRYHSATTDQNGNFTIRTIPPGDYKLFAWEDLEPYAYFDPEFMRRCEALGTPVHISEDSRLIGEFPIIPRPIE